MQTGLPPLQQRCGIALLPCRNFSRCPLLRQASQPAADKRHRAIVHCCNSDTDQKQHHVTSQRLLGLAAAVALSTSTLTLSDQAVAKTNPPKKTDPYEELQKIVNNRGGSGSDSLLDSFKKQAEEAAKIPAEVVKAPAELFKAPAAKETPALPLPITKALPQPTSKPAAAKPGGVSGGLLFGVGALVLAAGTALSNRGGNKAPAPKPNKIKARIKGGAQQAGRQASKQTSKPSFSLPSLGSKAKQASKQASKQAPKPSFSLPSVTGKAKQASKQATKQAPKPSFSLPGLGSKAKQASKQAPKPMLSLPSLGGKGQQVGRTAKIKAGAAPQKAKQAASKGTGLFGTASTRAKSSNPTGPLGTRSTRPAAGGTQKTGTQKMKAAAAAATSPVQQAVNTGGKSIINEDNGSTLGAVGVVGLAVAVGGLALSSITSSGDTPKKAPAEVRQLLDRVPEPLPVVKRAATQVASQVQDAPTLRTPSSPPQISPPSVQPPPVPTPKDTLPPIAQTPKTPSGPDLVPELMQKPKTGAPLAPPPSDATKPKIPSGPDLRVPGPPTQSLEGTPQLIRGPAKKATEATPPVAQAATTSDGNLPVVLGLGALAIGGVLFAAPKNAGPGSKEGQASSTAKSSAEAQEAPKPSASGGQAPQSAEEAAADAKQRAGEARKWIDNWKSKQ